MIAFEPNEKGYSVKVPFELKDAFKAVFKTAKKDEESTEWRWQVGPRSLKKLEQFIADTEAEVAAIAAQKQAQEEQDSIEYDIAKLRVELQKIQTETAAKLAELKEAKELQNQLEQAKAALQVSTEGLDSVAKELATEKEKIAVHKNDLKELLKSVIDIDRVFALKRILESNHDPKNRDKKERFKNAQNELKQMINALEKVNLTSLGINQLYYANVNRPDQNVRNINNDAIFNIQKTTE